VDDWHRISRTEDLEDFVELWEKIQAVHLTDNRDSVTWTLADDGIYSAKSAYDAQFHERDFLPNLSNIWKTKLEEKVHFFV
jgi:hypothetical protein